MDLLDCPLVMSELVKHANRCFEEMEVKVFTSGREVTQATINQLVRDSEFWSNVLECYSVGHQQPVACMLPSSLERLQLRLSLANYGAVQVTLDPAGHPRQWQQELEQSGCRLLFTDSTQAAALLPHLSLNSCLEAVVIIDDQPLPMDYPAQLEVVLSCDLRTELPPSYHWCPLDEGSIFATGTGDGKPLSHRKAVLQALSAVQADAFNLTADDRVLVLARPSPDNPLLELSMCLLVGADLLIADPIGWSPQELVDIILAEGVTKVIGADPLVNALDQVTLCQADRLSSLRELFFSDEQLTRHGYARLHHKFDLGVKHYWRNQNGALGGFVFGKPGQELTTRGMRARPLFSDSSGTLNAAAGSHEVNDGSRLLNTAGIHYFSH